MFSYVIAMQQIGVCVSSVSFLQKNIFWQVFFFLFSIICDVSSFIVTDDNCLTHVEHFM